MKIDWLVKSLLAIIAILLGVIAVRPYVVPNAVAAQNGASPTFYIEPGTTMLRAPEGDRQVLGKVIIDLRNGNVWGFPTLAQTPYPAAGSSGSPPTSHPFLLGNFVLKDVEK